MKTYFPYFFKRIGILFVFSSIIISSVCGVDDFRLGWLGLPYDYNKGDVELNVSLENDNIAFESYFTEEETKPWVSFSLILSIMGFVLYLFSKEKIDDEFLEKLRFISLSQSLLLTWLVVAFFYFVFIELMPKGFYILQLQLFFYTIIYVYNKNWKYADDL